MSGLLDEVLAKIRGMTPADRALLDNEVRLATKKMTWVPNPGSQTTAYFSQADIIGYGGEAGPGKTSLIIGKALNQHRRSLVLRKTNKEASKLSEAFEEVLGHRNGLNAQSGVWRIPNTTQVIDYGGCEHEHAKQKYKGNPHDFIAFDEVVDFSRSQVEFIMQWNRTTDVNQRCQVLMTFNPPTSPTGLWVIEYFGPWLDPKHPHPAEYGELRWFTTVNGRDTEVEGRGPHLIDGELIEAKSRTFIRGYLKENVALASTGYDATRAAAPKDMRAAYRHGDFEAALADFPGQIIPTAWVRAAQARWSEAPPKDIPMCAIGVDCSGGGTDPMVLARRHDGWFAELIEIAGETLEQERMGSQTSGIVFSYMRDGAIVNVDMGGGYGSSLYERLHAGGIEVRSHKGSERSTARTRCRKLGFVNKRTEVIWKFREALDPDQEGGSPIALPQDRELVADLTSVGFETTPNGIKADTKEAVCERLGRSTNKGDAVVMAWAAGPRMATHYHAWQAGARGANPPRVVLGHAAARRALRR